MTTTSSSITIQRELEAHGGEIVETVGEGNATMTLFQVLHVKNIGGDGLVGWSVIRLAKESIGLGLAAEKYFGGRGGK